MIQNPSDNFKQLLEKHIQKQQDQKNDNISTKIDKTLHHQINIQGIEISFPNKPYDCQIKYMEQVIQSLNEGTNALLQSPTGTGKVFFFKQTLSLLCSSLAWINHMKLNTNTEYKIVYCSRTHSQLKQVINELKKTIYRPNQTILGSKDQFCIKKEFNGSNGQELNDLCNQSRKHKNKNNSCKYYFNLLQNQKTINQKLETQLFDIEDLKNYGLSNNFCPYYQAFSKIDNYEIVFVPYNYLLSYKTLKSTKINLGSQFYLENSIVIVDEAHNIEKISEEGYSITLQCSTLEKSDQNLRQVYELLNSDFKDVQFIDIQSIMGPLQGMIHWLAKIPFNRQIQYTIIEFLQQLQQNTQNDSKNFTSGLNSVNLQQYTNILQRILNIEELSLHSLDQYHIFFDQICQILKKMNQSNENQFKIYINHKDEGFPEITLQCFSPMNAIQQLKQRGVRNFILTSGTLEPMNCIVHQLNIPFQIQYKGPHVADLEQNLCAMIMKKGKFDGNMNFSYKNGDQSYFELGESIYEISKISPSGIVVVFSSYQQMNLCYQNWINNRITNKITQIKKLFKEPKDKKKFQETLKEFQKHATQGSIFLTVQRGNITEGINLPDDLIRTIILVGIPYPPVNDPIIESKKTFMSQEYPQTMNGDYWYQQQALKAINQAMGRIIRHKDDWGTVQFLIQIILCDERYSYTNIQDNLSDWIKTKLKTHENFEKAYEELNDFFKQKNQVKQVQIQNTNINQYLKPKNEIQNDQNLHNIDISPSKKYQKKKIKLFNNNQEDENSKITYNQDNLLQMSMKNQQNDTPQIDMEFRDYFSKTTQNLIQQNQQPIKVYDTQCNICYADDKKMKYSKHCACEDCWQNWLKQKLECPKCKLRVREKQLIDYVKQDN